jgi:hypothetical protein
MNKEQDIKTQKQKKRERERELILNIYSSILFHLNILKNIPSFKSRTHLLTHAHTVSITLVNKCKMYLLHS